ncbi:MAG: LacI family DNA-binding transcriptional regulator [Lachnospiraceae bacterium]|nr:LacI family DNA-binding transcriptional regulator [Lachnospiraceae bacterium]
MAVAGNNLTITDIADALNISKTTVSRAISGKGRIGSDTREKVLKYIDDNNYVPNPMAKGLAQSKTYNICWVTPADSVATELPFFQRCMMGIADVTGGYNYDILVSMVYEDNINQLKRIITNKKVDGAILGRTLVNDLSVEFLKKSEIPFVVIGSTEIKNITQVDNDHIRACKELTSILVMKGVKKIAIIGGSLNHVVNRTRRDGFLLGLKEQGVKPDEELIYVGSDDSISVERAVDDALRNGAECLVCMDDGICANVLAKLKKDGVEIPSDIKVASFYNSVVLENNQPAITTLSYDPKELGATACKVLFDKIAGKTVQNKLLLSYDVLLKGSTQ